MCYWIEHAKHAHQESKLIAKTKLFGKVNPDKRKVSHGAAKPSSSKVSSRSWAQLHTFIHTLFFTSCTILLILFIYITQCTKAIEDFSLQGPPLSIGPSGAIVKGICASGRCRLHGLRKHQRGWSLMSWAILQSLGPQWKSLSFHMLFFTVGPLKCLHLQQGMCRYDSHQPSPWHALIALHGNNFHPDCCHQPFLLNYFAGSRTSRWSHPWRIQVGEDKGADQIGKFAEISKLM